jgi:quercetin dioxygenase-like cupin family protein
MEKMLPHFIELGGTVMKNIFPEPILNLPEAQMPLAGCQGYLLQGEKQQIIFMAFSQDTDVPEHAHASQFEVVLEGKAEMIIGGEKRTYAKGDSFYVPEGTPHSAHITAGYAAMAFFNQKDRYTPKP